MKQFIPTEKGEKSPWVFLLHPKAITITTPETPRPGPLELLSTLLPVFRCIEKKKKRDVGPQLTWVISIYPIFAFADMMLALLHNGYSRISAKKEKKKLI